jgi:intracellular sulfur oxidation DsrE/DsrF family protein
MKLRSILALALVCTFALSGVTALSAQTPAAPPAHTHRIILAITSGDKTDWEISIHNTNNLLKGFAPDPVEIEIVAFGPGIAVLKADSSVRADLDALQKKGVHLAACHNSMMGNHLTLADMIPGTIEVPSGAVEVVKKQEEGWSYIKGGR